MVCFWLNETSELSKHQMALSNTAAKFKFSYARCAKFCHLILQMFAERLGDFTFTSTHRQRKIEIEKFSIYHTFIAFKFGNIFSMRPPGVDDEVEVEQVQASAVWPGAGVKTSMNID